MPSNRASSAWLSASAMAMRARAGPWLADPVDQPADQPAQRTAGEDVAEAGTGRPERPAQRDARIEVGGGDADPRGGGGEAALGGAHVGAAGEQRGAVADRDRLVDAQRGGPRAGFGRQIGGRAPGERGEAEQRGLALGGERGDVGLALVAQRGDPGGVEAGREADFAAPLGDRDRLVEQLHDPLRHREPLRGRGGIGIGARGLGRRPRRGPHRHPPRPRRCRRAPLPRRGPPGRTDRPHRRR